jgi:hypothetical protein
MTYEGCSKISKIRNYYARKELTIISLNEKKEREENTEKWRQHLQRIDGFDGIIKEVGTG